MRYGRAAAGVIIIALIMGAGPCEAGRLQDGNIRQDDTCQPRADKQQYWSPNHRLVCQDMAAPSSSDDWRWGPPPTR